MAKNVVELAKGAVFKTNLISSRGEQFEGKTSIGTRDEERRRRSDQNREGEQRKQGGGVASSATGNGTRVERRGRSDQRRAETGERELRKQGERERGGGGMHSLRANKIWGIGARDAARKVYTGHKMFIHGGAVCGGKGSAGHRGGWAGEVVDGDGK
jgi:hypothetical protein